MERSRKKGIVIGAICVVLAALIVFLAIYGSRQHKLNQTTNRFVHLKAGYNMPYAVTVNTAQEIVTVYEKDSKTGLYTVPVKAFVCSTGLHRGDTPEKTYYMPADCRRTPWWPLNGGVYGKVATRISPQSEHILFHTVPYMKPGDSSSLEPGEYNKLGKPASQGCVRMRVSDVTWIYRHLDPGTCVKIYYDPDAKEPLKPQKAKKVTDNPKSKYYGWDPTDSDPQNPYLS